MDLKDIKLASFEHKRMVKRRNNRLGLQNLRYKKEKKYH